MGLAEQLAPAQPEDMDVEIDVPELGPVKLDIAYGGMFYAIVDAKKLDLELLPHNGRRICRLGEMIKVACREQHPVNHPEFDYPGCDILVFTDLQRKDQGKMLGKNAVVMSNGRLSWDNPDSWTGMIDRSPCGTGTCAVMAQLHARGGLELSEEFVHESILGTHFVGELLEEVRIGQIDRVIGVHEIERVSERQKWCRCHRSVSFNQANLVQTSPNHSTLPKATLLAVPQVTIGPTSAPVHAVVPRISGRAWITQRCEIVCDPSDPFPQGYTIGDIWSANE